MKLFFRYWFPLLVYCSMIYFVSTMEASEIHVPVSVSDKVLHFVEFGLLGLLASRAFVPGTKGFFTPGEAFTVTVLFSASFGALDELIQSYTPGRYMEFRDLAADIAGAATASGGYFILRGWYFDRKSKRICGQEGNLKAAGEEKD